VAGPRPHSFRRRVIPALFLFLTTGTSARSCSHGRRAVPARVFQGFL